MNNKIAVIEDSNKDISSVINCLSIQYGNQSKDKDINNWIIKLFKRNTQIEKLIILVRLGIDDADYKGLRIGLHIRLTMEIEDKMLIPLIFISQQCKEDILQNQVTNAKEKSALLLFTLGSTIVNPSNLKTTIANFSRAITKDELKKEVIPNLIIENTRDLGHQLANEWGAFRLAKFAGVELNKDNIPTDLYFKYKYSQTETDIVPIDRSNIGLIDKNCKSILIDDNANKGWGTCLDEILKKRILAVGKKSKLKTVESYEEADKITNYADYDLVFLDLRLLAEEDKPNLIRPVEEFSGAKLLKKIKAQNKGTQVIVFTASNKAWNMKKLLEMGADGYYIKESPEFYVDDNFSKENYDNLKKEIESCLSDVYLKEVFEITKKVKDYLDNTSKGGGTGLEEGLIKVRTIEEIKTQIDIATDILTNNIQERLSFAMLILYRVIEIITEYYIDSVRKNERIIFKRGQCANKELMYCDWNKSNKTYQLVKNPSPPNEWNKYNSIGNKIQCICWQELNLCDNSLLIDIYDFSKYRNDFIHPEKRYELRELTPENILGYFRLLKIILSKF